MTTKPLNLTSLGSSFAAGPGIPPITSRPAGRSAANYPHLLAAHLNAQLTDLTVSGATLLNILSEPQTSFLSRTQFAPQIQGVKSDVDIVTITAGGNDMGYIGGVMYDTLHASFFGRILAWILRLQKPKKVTDDDVRIVKERFIRVIDAIHKIAPQAKILLVEYLTLFGGDTRPGRDVRLDGGQIEKYRDVAGLLGRAYQEAAEERKGLVRVVGVAGGSWGHGLGSEVPWVEGGGWGVVWRRKAPFHPNAEGMRGVAEMVFRELKSSGWISTETGDGGSSS